MPKEIDAQRRFMANWFVLSVNIMLLALLVLTWLMRLHPSATVVGKDAKTLGMDVYCERSPFAVFVNKDFPQNQGFAFTRYGLPLFLTSEDVTEPSQPPLDRDRDNKAQAAQNVMLGFGEDYFTISCVYSATNAVHVDELLVTRNDGGHSESFFDLNADGFPDLRLIVDQKQDVHRSEIWYGGKWQEAIAQGKKYEKQLPGGEKVRFDRQGGLWVLADEAKGDGRKEGAHAAKK